MKLVGLCILVFVVMANAADDADKKCVPGSKIMRECNECVCSNDGKHLGCTRMACPEIPDIYKNPDGSWKTPEEVAKIVENRPKRDIETTCVPGSTRMVECNRCTCVPDGSVEICTKMFCHPGDRRKREVFTCTPYSYFKMECNNCVCGPDGRTAACNLMACPP